MNIRRAEHIRATTCRRCRGQIDRAGDSVLSHSDYSIEQFYIKDNEDFSKVPEAETTLTLECPRCNNVTTNVKTYAVIDVRPRSLVFPHNAEAIISDLSVPNRNMTVYEGATVAGGSEISTSINYDFGSMYPNMLLPTNPCRLTTINLDDGSSHES